MQPRARVTAADIARLANVGRAAVSNWRKRYASFPVPVGGTAASPQFDLEQVERWLVDEGKLPAVADEDRLWRNLLAAAGDPAEALAAAGEHLGGVRELPFEGLRPELAALADRHGKRGAFEQLWRRFADLPGQRAVTTPDPLADLMAGLAKVDGGSVLDPACGTGRLLRAAIRAGAGVVYGQDNDSAATRLAQLWVSVNDLTGDIRTGDSLRHDAYGDLAVDAVVANLPFGLTNWGHEELGYDRRWEFGVPPRTEPELAWVQHALAHVKPDGRAVLLMPPSAASRRAGRRIRAELLRRGAILAIIALPPGAAAPHAIGLHLWVLQRTPTPAGAIVLVDAATDSVDEAYRKIVEAVESGGKAGNVVPVIDLLDEEVDLTPGRHSPAAAGGVDAATALRQGRERLAAIVETLPGLIPEVGTEPGEALPAVTVAELIRAGQVQLLGPVKAGAEAVDRPVLTGDDVANARPPARRTDPSPTPEIDLRPGDVVVPVLASRLHARVVTEEGALLGRGLYLLRGNPETLDPWFLAGYLRTSANERQASSSSSSGSSRFDPRRAQVPRIPVVEQRRHGEVFRKLQLFDDAVREATALSGLLSRHTANSLASGSAQP
ncbi:N-6 DNA methylase [Actinoplanes sp. TBRC 11911]|uniref:N-6 DNA methylase n=1 Tax=Actinoplanes sp. TBRC 11911 TaxID=2729386 RepID=UPI00145D3083|nr:N-6 DNA methylase [Actinoplanes sp. TBRC 11911]NMO57587.1 N-6 DNA methylase [Actinoplanes sp. TBRC 11911]